MDPQSFSRPRSCATEKRSGIENDAVASGRGTILYTTGKKKLQKKNITVLSFPFFFTLLDSDMTPWDPELLSGPNR